MPAATVKPVDTFMLRSIVDSVYRDMEQCGCKMPDKGDLHFYIRNLGIRTFGRCHRLDPWRDGATGYEISINTKLAKLGADSVAETICHELIHAMGIHGHGPRFRRIAKLINLSYPKKYNVARTNSWQRRGLSEKDAIAEARYALKCPRCGTIFPHQRMCNIVRYPENSWCVKCHKVDPSVRLIRVK